MPHTCWTHEELLEELERYEKELRRTLQPGTVFQYMDPARRFVRWLNGQYKPRGST